MSPKISIVKACDSFGNEKVYATAVFQSAVVPNTTVINPGRYMNKKGEFVPGKRFIPITNRALTSSLAESQTETETSQA